MKGVVEQSRWSLGRVTQPEAAEAEGGGGCLLFVSSYKHGIYLQCGVGIFHVTSGHYLLLQVPMFKQSSVPTASCFLTQLKSWPNLPEEDPHSSPMKMHQVAVKATPQMPSSNWVEDDRVGGTKSPILFTAYDLEGISL